VDEVFHSASDVACADRGSDGSDDCYDVHVDEYAAKISRSGQMRNLATALVDAGLRSAREAFPDLKKLPDEMTEELTSFMAVSVVSAVIQERAHLLARAKILADVLPQEQAAGIELAIQEELGALDDVR
jgi:hypothetical protein